MLIDDEQLMSHHFNDGEDSICSPIPGLSIPLVTLSFCLDLTPGQSGFFVYTNKVTIRAHGRVEFFNDAVPPYDIDLGTSTDRWQCPNLKAAVGVVVGAVVVLGAIATGTCCYLKKKKASSGATTVTVTRAATNDVAGISMATSSPDASDKI